MRPLRGQHFIIKHNASLCNVFLLLGRLSKQGLCVHYHGKVKTERAFERKKYGEIAFWEQESQGVKNRGTWRYIIKYRRVQEA
jgi:hypothetical protein